MDELLIEGKRYISSKQAAKLTGYAKDYIGQLCREGRVPARLVGRSWYVLEAAIHDHRFGAVAVESIDNSSKIEEKTAAAPLSYHMEPPRYEAATLETLSPLPPLVKNPEEEAPEAENLHESWQAWFAQPDLTSEASEAEESPAAIAVAVDEPEVEVTDEEVPVPVRAIHHTLYQPTIAHTMPQVSRQYAPEAQANEVMPVDISPRRSVSFMRTLQLSGVLLATVMVIAAVLGSGYFDSYLLSNKQVSLVAGVSLYNK